MKKKIYNKSNSKLKTKSNNYFTNIIAKYIFKYLSTFILVLLIISAVYNLLYIANSDDNNLEVLSNNFLSNLTNISNLFNEEKYITDNGKDIDTYTYTDKDIDNKRKIVSEKINEEISEKTNKEITSMQLYVIMYHSVQDDETYRGKYIISKNTFENDLKYFNEMGYKYINADDLINMVYGNKKLEEKAIMLTFDDGHYNFISNVIPLINKYNAKATVSVVGCYTLNDVINKDKSNRYSYLSIDDLKNISLNKNISILNHSYNLHTINDKIYGARRLNNESDDNYRKRFISDVMACEFMFEDNQIRHTYFYTYPFGASTDISRSVIKDIGMLGSLSCCEGINIITKNIDSLYDIKRYNREDSLKSSCEYFYNIIR